VARLRHDDEIEDSIHEVFIQIFRNIDGLRDPACLDFWSERIANNVVNTVIRRRTRMRRLSEAYELATQENFFIHDWIGHSLARRVMAAIARMSPRDAELLYAYWFEPGTYEQMAARSKCSISKMTRRLQRARARFSAVASHDPRLACLMEG
jgi:RNA polymerase sigma factor (sigma-70 family)